MYIYKDQTLYQNLRHLIGLHHCRSRQLLENQGVYPGQPPLLFALDKEDGQSNKELSEKLGIQPATVTMMVKRMNKAGLIERRQDGQDQRISRVYLTEEGRQTSRRAAIIVEKIEADCFSSLSKEEKESLNKILIKMTKSLSKKC